MTVAAVILSATVEGSIALADGVARVRRLADVAWSGGAIPVVVVAADPDGAVAAALAGSEARLVAPVDASRGPAGQMAHGVRCAVEAVRDTDAALLLPARLCWVDAETLTSLIEAHGASREPVFRPTYHGVPGWPVLLPVGHLDALASLGPDRLPDDLVDDLAGSGIQGVAIDLGDPGSVIDCETPRGHLPPYEGPPGPSSGVHHEWGATAADRPDGDR